MSFDINNSLETLSKYIGDSQPLCLIVFQEYGPWSHEDRLDSDCNLISDVLVNKKLENFNWFSFCVGLIIRLEKENRFDLFNLDFFSSSIDNTKKRIDSKNLPKSEIGFKGWHVIGYDSLDFFDGSKKEKISNRKNLRLKKEGKILEEDKSLFCEVARKDDLVLYFLPALEEKEKDLDKLESQKKSRKRLLCKYGKNTEWCTANPTGDHSDSFAFMPIYILHVMIGDEYKPMYQFTEGQFRDKSNEEIFSESYLPSDICSFLSSNIKNLESFFEEDSDEDDYDDYYDDDEDEDEDDDDYEDDEDEDDEDEDEIDNDEDEWDEEDEDDEDEWDEDEDEDEDED